ncbi:DUF2285 domain-containing protein [Inquilinus sp. CAU 1745]|uniref:DUF2285 domain-containing protein n=1 Tax=Inquilinus sp. CAU 1745 TaxID=3140369 RepID=UPI00325B0F00
MCGLNGRTQANWKPSLGAGGCDFPHDPDDPPDRDPLFWSPRFQPQAIKLVPAEPVDARSDPTIDLAHLDGLVLRRAADGWHGIWQVNGVEHQFWLPEPVPHAAAFYAVTLPLDDFMELRAHAARRFWRSLKGRSPGRDFRDIPDQLRQWHILSLRALDARLRGESYRTIAEVLLGFRGTKEDFESDPRKSKARRLVAHGKKMMRGGYRLLLHYPIKIGSQGNDG